MTPLLVREKLFPHMRADTSFDKSKWSEENPTGGHCAVVAIIIQDICGGALVSGRYGGHSHWFNKINDVYYDMTFDQYPYCGIVDNKITHGAIQNIQTRQWDELNNETLQRAALLATRAGFNIPKICKERLMGLTYEQKMASDDEIKLIPQTSKEETRRFAGRFWKSEFDITVVPTSKLGKILCILLEDYEVELEDENVSNS